MDWLKMFLREMYWRRDGGRASPAMEGGRRREKVSGEAVFVGSQGGTREAGVEGTDHRDPKYCSVYWSRLWGEVRWPP